MCFAESVAQDSETNVLGNDLFFVLRIWSSNGGCHNCAHLYATSESRAR